MTLSRDMCDEALRNSGFRLTPQRAGVLEYFFNLPEGEHLSAEALFRMLKQKDSSISLATLYRTLKLLASIGVLRELDFAEDHKHYELARNPQAPHHHLICIDCRKAFEFESPATFELAQETAQAQQFKVMDIQLQVYGLCHPCQTTRKPGTVPRPSLDSAYAH